MNLRERIVCSYGIARMPEHQKLALLRLVESQLPPPDYRGHGYFVCFSFADDTILLEKREDETVELVKCCDMGNKFYQL